MFKLTFPSLILGFSILFQSFQSKTDKSGDVSGPPVSGIQFAEFLYRQIGDPELPLNVFKPAITVYEELIEKGLIKNRKVITLIDFSQPSSKERLFVVDLVSKKIVFKSLVAHGKNSGEYYATSFSNDIQSHQSSPGFYLTGNTYQGRHGYSLTLKGLEKGINDNAWKRSVVIHGAAYVSQAYIERYGRLGRSFGCPALPLENASEIIDTIQNGSLLFIYTKEENYLKNSRFFNSFSSSP
jgi:hypothetical protein